ncbi:hypothetical protein IWX78_000788 [Mycetocola sp. CAN_C7]|uniref:hypothetical protein n=1 Tax=Mycetocola sp. CAN_C7 TaxID=2787724 RepID=UPI0018CBBB23
MATREVPYRRTRLVRSGRVSVAASLSAAAVLLVSAMLQFVASLQRWVVFRNSLTANEISAEDHLYDYTIPMDPWVPIGTAAELYGAGVLLTALGILILPLSAWTGRRAFRYRGVAVAVFVGEFLIALLVAGSLSIDGAHALISGVSGSPSPLQHWGALGWVSVIGLTVMAVLWRGSRALMVACIFLLGSTFVGYLMATFVIAPMLSGGSHDTAPWTETVVAASVAIAGVAMASAARPARQRMPVRPTSAL